MVFSSTIFLFLFLPIVLGIYILLPKVLRNAFILIASLFFYTWGEPYLIGVMIATILVNYVCGLIISNGLSKGDIQPLEAGGERTREQNFALGAALFANLTLLGFFKYFNFAIDSMSVVLGYFGIPDASQFLALNVALPLGISFFTFQAMSYIIDVYRGNVAATRNLINFATYISLFPQLVAGPIVRYQQIAEELHERTVTMGKMSEGVHRFIIGLGKKVLIANVVAWPADQIFALPDSEITLPLAWLAIVCYTLQIYFDFSGYSDMAIGLGLIFGFHFPENFNVPYIAQSIQEFWRRWHISLSTWFRDYLYIPLGGNQKGSLRTYFNLFLVFFLCGLWHGASWTFVIWGIYHGVFLILERTPFGTLIGKSWRPLRHVYTLIVVLFGWLIFRAESYTQLHVFLLAMLNLSEASPQAPSILLYLNNELILVMVVGILFSTPLFKKVTETVKQHLSNRNLLSASQLELAGQALSSAFISLVFIYSIICLSAQTHNPFIYFRF